MGNLFVFLVEEYPSLPLAFSCLSLSRIRFHAYLGLECGAAGMRDVLTDEGKPNVVIEMAVSGFAPRNARRPRTAPPTTFYFTGHYLIGHRGGRL